MATPHISAQMGDFAKTVLMPGDPLRAKLIAETFLENPKLVTSVRNIYGFTGTYKGKPISVMASGMGMPSIGIYSYELFTQFGVENIVRIGSAGSYTPRLRARDVVLAESAYSDSSYAQFMSRDSEHCKKPSAELNEVIQQTAKELEVDCKLAKVHSSDVFYAGPEMGGWQTIAKETDTECTEMESFALFHNANVLGKKAACLLTISDYIPEKVALTAEERQNSFTTMMKLALESAIRF